MAAAPSRRSFSPERSPAGPPPRRWSLGSCAKQWLAALLLILASTGVSKATVDLTGDWYEVASFAGVFLDHVVQTGSSLQIGGVQATIDPATGAFESDALFFCPLYDLCPCFFRAQASMDGNTFAGEFYTVGPTPGCTSATCACLGDEFPIGSYYGSRSPCGNGSVDPGEACDDGSVGRSGACCSLDCTHPVAPAGQLCIDDGTLCTNGTCDGTGSCTHPIVPAGQSCADDGDPCTGDVCDATGICTHPVGPAGQPCSEDYNFCTSDICDATGACTHPLLPAGTVCESDVNRCTRDICDATGTCTHVPQTCRSAERSYLLVKHESDMTKDRLIWKWTRGATTSQAEFADPTSTADYALCIFTGTASALVDAAVVPASASMWRSLGTAGYVYKDAAATARGITKIALKGSDQNKSKVRLKGKGAALPTLPLPATAPVTVQLVNGDNGLCWGASFSDAQLVNNDSGQLKAKAP